MKMVYTLENLEERKMIPEIINELEDTTHMLHLTLSIHF